jgi:hypothetical protein
MISHQYSFTLVKSNKKLRSKKLKVPVRQSKLRSLKDLILKVIRMKWLGLVQSKTKRREYLQRCWLTLAKFQTYSEATYLTFTIWIIKNETNYFLLIMFLCVFDDHKWLSYGQYSNHHYKYSEFKCKVHSFKR